MTPLSTPKSHANTNTDSIDQEPSTQDQADQLGAQPLDPVSSRVEDWEILVETKPELLSAGIPSASVERADEDSTHADFTFDEEVDVEIDPSSC